MNSKGVPEMYSSPGLLESQSRLNKRYSSGAAQWFKNMKWLILQVFVYVFSWHYFDLGVLLQLLHGCNNISVFGGLFIYLNDIASILIHAQMTDLPGACFTNIVDRQTYRQKFHRQIGESGETFEPMCSLYFDVTNLLRANIACDTGLLVNKHGIGEAVGEAIE